MVQTRRAAKAGVITPDAPSTFNNGTQAVPEVLPKLVKTNSKSRKRKATAQQELHLQPETSKRRSTGCRAPVPKELSNKNASISSKPPRLTRPDLEFEYDRSKLRDSRPTPGRKTKPCYDEMDIPKDLHARLKKTREFVKVKARKGRLSVAQQLAFDAKEALSNPLEFSHDLYKCLAKGRAASPTYDPAGFELDYDKVNAAINGVFDSEEEEEKHERYEEMLDNDEREEKEPFKTFLIDPGKPYKGKVNPMEIENYIKDRVSKDLGVPWHQIDSQRIKDWRRKGFERVKFETWWKTPTEEEDKRMLKMMTGSDLRKDM
jgi:hypothetical protein